MNSVYFGRRARNLMSDFGMLIAIVIVTGLRYYFGGVMVEAVEMHNILIGSTNMTVDYSNRDEQCIQLLLVAQRLVPWQFPEGQEWAYGFALVPALLLFILLFVEIGLMEVILSSKERKLRKGQGFHWDILLIGILTFISSILGLPWMCSSVQSIAHSQALTVMKKHAPGERPRVDYVIEQRVSGLIISFLVGFCVLGTDAFRLLPIAVLMGIFLYLAVMNLFGIEFVERIVLFFIPQKYYPDKQYCQKVSMWRMHLFTGIQILCLVTIYVVKQYKASTLAFPFVLVIISIFRRVFVSRMFSDAELTALDGHEPHEQEGIYGMHASFSQYVPPKRKVGIADASQM